MMLGYRFQMDNLWVYSRVRPPNFRWEVLPFVDEIASLFLGNHRLHTVVTDMQGKIVEKNERIC
jgi:hypothetical protein